MNMRSELFNCICELNTCQNQSIKIIFTNKTENIFTDGFELTESYNCGSLKCIKLIIKLGYVSPFRDKYAIKTTIP